MFQKSKIRFMCSLLVLSILISLVPLQVMAAEPSVYLVKFKDSVTNRVVITRELNDGDAITTPTAAELKSFDTPVDQQIVGWYRKGDNSQTLVDFNTLTCTEDLTLLAKYDAVDHCYVFFIAESNDPYVATVNAAETVVPHTVARPGWTLLYWSADDGETAFDFDTPITQHTTLKSIWTPETVEFKVMFFMENANLGHEADPENMNDYTYLQTITLQGKSGESTNVYQNTLDDHDLSKYFLGQISGSELRYTDFQAADNQTISGDGTTVINAFVTRREYTICYDIGNAGQSMIFEGKTYTGSDDVLKTTVKYGNWLNGPNSEIEYTEEGSSRKVTAWNPDSNMSDTIDAGLRRSTVLSPSYLSADGQISEYTFTAVWSTTQVKFRIRYWVEPLDISEGVRLTVSSAPFVSIPVDIDGKTFVHLSQLAFVHYGNQIAISLAPPKGFTALNANVYGSAQTITKIYQSEDTEEFYVGSGVENTSATWSGFFSRNSYNLIFDLQVPGGTTVENAPTPSQSIKFEVPLKDYEPTTEPTRDGYKFLGWYENLDFNNPYVFDGATMPARDIVLYAKWREILPEYTINFYEYYGGPLLTSIKVEEGGSPVEPIDYVLNEAYSYGKFGGWRYYADQVSDISSEFLFYLPVYQDFEVFASWDPGHYQVTYHLGAGTGICPTDADQYITGTKARIASNAGFSGNGNATFLHWEDADGVVFMPDSLNLMTSDLSLTAIYEAGSPNQEPSSTPHYRITYVSNGGTGTLADSGNPYKSGETVSVLSPDGALTPPSGHEFVEWNTKKDGSGTSYAPDDTFKISSNITVYAQWKAKEIINGTYTITYDPNGGVGSLTDQESPYQEGSFLTVLSPDGSIAPGDEDSVFVGWNTMPDGSGATFLPGNRLQLTEDVILYAQWKKIVSVEIVYDANGGQGTLVDEHGSYLVGDTVTVLSPLGSIYKEGSGFICWNTEPDGSGIRYSVSERFRITEDVTLYAQWRSYGGSSGDGTVTILDPIPPLGSWLLNLEDHYTYIIGYTDGTVKPLGHVTRDETATIFFRLLAESTRQDNLTHTNSFNDVASERWFNTAISTLSSGGIILGYPNGDFRPSDRITRAEFATIASRFDETEINAKITFSDTAGHWAEAEISRAACLGWIQGKPDGSFAPDEFITRAEVVTIVNRMLLRVTVEDPNHLSDVTLWPDNPKEEWYYFDILEATNSHRYERSIPGSHAEYWTEIMESPDWLQYER